MIFKDTLIMQKIIARMAKGFSPVILVVGPPNSGKTCLSALGSEVLSEVFHNEPWDCSKYTTFDMNDFSHKFLDSQRRSFVIAEAGYDLAFDEWFNKTNRFFDKIVTTQRVMGNAYWLNIPVGKDLARRHRRKVNYIFQVKKHGIFRAIINRVKSDVMVGNEFKPFSLETYLGVPLPKCHDQLAELDRTNKERIRNELVEDYQNDQKRKEEIRSKKRDLPAKITCHKCDHNWQPMKNRPLRCPGCNAKLRYEDPHKPGLVPLKTNNPHDTLAELDL